MFKVRILAVIERSCFMVVPNFGVINFVRSPLPVTNNRNS